MNWTDNNEYNRSVSDQGYVLTWQYNTHGKWINAWARRKDGERRGKHLGAGYSRGELERICDEHHAKSVQRETSGAL